MTVGQLPVAPARLRPAVAGAPARHSCREGLPTDDLDVLLLRQQQWAAVAGSRGEQDAARLQEQTTCSAAQLIGHQQASALTS